MRPEPAPLEPAGPEAAGPESTWPDAATSIRAALAAAARRLAPHSDTPRLDAELLMAHALGVDRGQLLLADLGAPAPDGFDALVARREADEPVAYIVGRRAFWTIELEVGPGVLVPRPDSETLIDAAVDHFGARSPRTILDLGTGPGTLLLAALDHWWQAHGLGIDASEDALAYARRNAARLGLAPRAEFRLGNWADGVSGPFDLILCNPPYVETGADLPADVRGWEPPSALFAGADGLDDYRRLAPQILGLLAPDGVACIELGAGQADRVAALFGATGASTDTRADLGGHRRCLLVRA
ncbi:peptide chain release factor N(5)-glutamine methyltransferase [Allosphingosinicella deserti]|uniref:Release factor glutamine methyltransferase n=1 Tax=Allosphingosinicella deserti TaxID=2116704 RepID=A0A2P7QDY9_9SPHN|nr:peptide chain release factor N(5)-glutamine methyltransferase [Sphingomonas deserti]PSJ36181.1 peptide chain release factor N(5)-glutamine methyltransferase [Sphingomonas deserti]